MNERTRAAALDGPAARKHAVTSSGSPGGVPVLLGHGYGTDQGMWRRVRPLLDPHGPVLSYDLVGSGRTRLADYDRATYDSLHGYADDLVALLRELDAGPVRYVGHSVSGMIGVLAATTAPELFRSLTLLGPSPRYLNDAGYVGGFERADIDGLLDAIDSNYLGWAEQMAPALMGNPGRPELAGELRSSFAALDGGVARHFARVTFTSDHRADLGALTVPSRVLLSEEDLVVPPQIGDYLAEHLPGTAVRRLRATGHYAHLSAPDEVAAEILAPAA